MVAYLSSSEDSSFDENEAVARCPPYYGWKEVSFMFKKRLACELLIREVWICEYISNFTELVFPVKSLDTFSSLYL